MIPFSRIYARILEIIPTLENHPGRTVQAARLIQEWLDKGCDVDLDILPAINKKWVKTPNDAKITSPMYFHEAVLMAKDARLKTDDHKAREEENHAKNIAWHRARDIQSTRIGIREYEWLARYEAQHGPIVL